MSFYNNSIYSCFNDNNNIKKEDSFTNSLILNNGNNYNYYIDNEPISYFYAMNNDKYKDMKKFYNQIIDNYEQSEYKELSDNEEYNKTFDINNCIIKEELIETKTVENFTNSLEDLKDTVNDTYIDNNVSESKKKIVDNSLNQNNYNAIYNGNDLKIKIEDYDNKDNENYQSIILSKKSLKRKKIFDIEVQEDIKAENIDYKLNSNNHSNNKTKYSIWSDDIKDEIQNDLNKGLKVTYISKKYGINIRTLRRWKKNGINRKKGSGRKYMDPYLDNKVYLWYLTYYDKIPITSKTLRSVAYNLSKNPNFRASYGWLSRFKIKFPDIILTKY